MTSHLHTIMYGTAWKEDATEELVKTAIAVGFRAIDTANQRRHYYEEAVGKAIAQALQNGIRREELFIQTKFTSPGGQDHRIPYDVNADARTQVRQSFESSLKHLQVQHIDSYVLHGPTTRVGIADYDWEVWREMEALHKKGKTTHLGVSNVTLEQLNTLWDGAIVKPTFVQNRCFAQLGWDKAVREFCKEKGIIYQGFSLLTANPFALPAVNHIAEKHKKTPAQIILRFSQQIGMLVLTGTTNKEHMEQDLALDFDLTEEEMEFTERIAL